MGALLLVRHGQASFGADDYDVLSAVGEEQAGDVGRLLASRPEMPVVHGSLVRQRRTAELAARAAGWGGSAVVDAGWDELDTTFLFGEPSARRDGVLDPAAFQRAFEERTDRWLSGAHAGPDVGDDDPGRGAGATAGGAEGAPYAETWPAFRARCDAALEALAKIASEADGSACVVTSGGPIAAVVTRLLDADGPTYRRLLPVVANASVTTIVTGRRRLTLVSFNEHAHLATLTYR